MSFLTKLLLQTFLVFKIRLKNDAKLKATKFQNVFSIFSNLIKKSQSVTSVSSLQKVEKLTNSAFSWGSFTNYVDKLRQVGGQSNVHDCPRKVGRQSFQCPRGPKAKKHQRKTAWCKRIIESEMMNLFFSKIHCKICSQNFIHKEKQALLCIGLRSNLIGPVYIFLTQSGNFYQ